MTNKRPYLSAIIFFAILAAAVCLWQLFAVPVFQEKERLVRAENAAMAKDIAEIESMNGSLDILEGYMAAASNNISGIYASRAVTANDAAAQIQIICEGIGVTAEKIALGPEIQLFPAGEYAPALYSIESTFLVEGTEETGPAVIHGLENSPSADFEITSFVFTSFPPEGSEAEYRSEWIFSATLYFFKL